MSDPGSLDQLIAASAAALDLKIDPVWRDAVRQHLEIILRLGMQVGEFELSEDAEPAPTFEA